MINDTTDDRKRYTNGSPFNSKNYGSISYVYMGGGNNLQYSCSTKCNFINRVIDRLQLTSV